MNRNQRIELLPGAVVIAVAAFLVLRPGGAEEPARESSFTTLAQTSWDKSEAQETTTLEESGVPLAQLEVRR